MYLLDLSYAKLHDRVTWPVKDYFVTLKKIHFWKIKFWFFKHFSKTVFALLFFLKNISSPPPLFFFEKKVYGPSRWSRPGYPINFDPSLKRAFYCFFFLCGSPFFFGVFSAEIGRPKSKNWSVITLTTSKLITNHQKQGIPFKSVKNFLWFTIFWGNYHRPKISTISCKHNNFIRTRRVRFLLNFTEN